MKFKGETAQKSNATIYLTTSKGTSEVTLHRHGNFETSFSIKAKDITNATIEITGISDVTVTVDARLIDAGYNIAHGPSARSNLASAVSASQNQKDGVYSFLKFVSTKMLRSSRPTASSNTDNNT